MNFLPSNVYTMADPVSLTLSVLGIIAPALHGIRLLVNDLRSISDAPSTLKTLQADVSSVETALQSLETISQPQWEALGTAVLEQSQSAIGTCTTSCTKFRDDLQRWTRHSSNGTISVRDRVSLGFVRQSQVKSMSQQLQKYQTVLNLVVSTATLYVSSSPHKLSVSYARCRHNSIRNQNVTEELRDAIKDRNQEIGSSMTTTNQQLKTLENTFERFGIMEPDDNDIFTDRDEASMRQTIKEEHVLLQALVKLLEELKQKNEDEAKKMARGQERLVRVIFGDNNAGFQLGTNTGKISGFTFGA
jgi:hypothetical protein